MNAHRIGFNHHLWNALLVLLPIAVAAYCCAFFSLRKGFYYFDPRHNPKVIDDDRGSFEEHSKRYADLAKLIVTLSGGVIAFLINTLAAEKHSQFIDRLSPSMPIIFGFFGASTALLIAFLAVQAVWYEEYCHSLRHDSYVRWKYASSIFLGYTGLTSFVLGVGWLSENLFS